MKRKFGIRDYFVWGFMAITLVLLAFSMVVSILPADVEREARKMERIVSRKMAVLDKYIHSSLTADKTTWTAEYDLPEDMVIYRYINDSLQSWSNQFFVINDDISTRVVFQRLANMRNTISSPLAEVTEEPAFVNYGPKWYLVKSEVLGARRVIAGLEIINSMDDESVNGVNRSLRLNKGYSINPLSTSGGAAVMLEGRPVFKVNYDSFTGRSLATHSTLVWLALLSFMFGALLYLSNKRNLTRLLQVIAGIFVVMVAAYFWGNNIRDDSKLFSPSIYADGEFFNSLGAVLIASIFITTTIFCLFLTRKDIYRRVLQGNRPVRLNILITCLVLLILGVAGYTHLIFSSIILNSSISVELYNLNDLNVFSLIVYVIVFSLLLTLPLLAIMLAAALRKRFGYPLNLHSSWWKILFSVLGATYLVVMAGSLGFQKERDRVNVWANRLSMDRDISLELQLRTIEEQISTDPVIAALSARENSNNLILNRVAGNYMYQISQDYDLGVEIFPSSASPQEIAYFSNRIANGTVIANGSRFLYTRDGTGNSLYTGVFLYYSTESGVSRMLLSVASKSNREDRGYASILGITDPGQVLIPAKYSYARYASNTLSNYKGNYPYPTTLDEVQKSELLDIPSGILRTGGYTHFVNGLSDSDLVLVSRQKTEAFNYIVATLFLSLTLYFCLLAMSLAQRRQKTQEKNYYKSRINATMLGAQILTLITLATVSVVFVYKRNNANLRSSMSEKINSLQTLLESRFRYAQSYNDLNTQEAAMILEDISNTLRSDITLYTTSGKVFRSTTPEVFDKMLPGTRINQEAYENIVYRNRRYFINREDTGVSKCYFLYAPVFNAQDKLIAFLGSPYTDESFDFKTEAVLHSATIIVVFLILLLLSRFATEAVVDKMFQPLSEMGRKMNAADINNLEYIIYERDDEISRLVRAYNLMVHDLYNSTRQLTQAERDKAWATMARQVAHEIKNPLTPIKLQIQRLIRMKNNNNPAWTERFDEISREVLHQIDLLADTANEFSTFARLYTEEPVEIDLDQLLKDEIALFDSRDKISFSYMGLDGAKIKGPKPQLTRVFANLLGNAVQAIEHEQEEAREQGRKPIQGRVIVSLRLSTKEDHYDIVFEDNGPGVSDENRSKLFTPNFTTKTNGTGLGLAICRNILEKSNGEIFYSRSFTLQGACFTVRFPRFK
jgi:nitrogen fixation/metabolism regulation signal transduction histidine kinase